MWKLVIEDDEARRTVVPLSRDAYDVGRAEENAIRLTERNVSRRHARIARRTSPSGDEGYRLEDLASLTGVYVNGVRLEESVELAHGDLVVIGDYRISVENENVGPLAHESTNPELKVTRRDQQQSADPYRLLIVSGPDAGKVFSLGSGRTILGRAEDATIQLAHPSVSRHHAEVVVLPDARLELVDAGSSNGLVLNGKTIRREILEGGDLFELGDVRVRVLEPGAPVPQLAASAAGKGADDKPRAWLPAVVFVAVVAIGGAAAYIARQPSQLPSEGTVAAGVVEAPAPPTGPIEAPSPAPAEAPAPIADPIGEASALCKHQECDRARELLEANVPADDPRLTSAEGRAFFHDWAVDLVARAKLESDPELKRQLLERVRLEIHTSPADRERAKRALDSLAPPREAAPTASAAPRAAMPSPATAAPTATKTTAAAAAAATATTRVEAPKVTKSERAPRVEDPDKIRAWMMGSDAEKRMARDYLYARMQRGTASRDELKGLQGLCKDIGDTKCVEDAKNARNQETSR